MNEKTLFACDLVFLSKLDKKLRMLTKLIITELLAVEERKLDTVSFTL